MSPSTTLPKEEMYDLLTRAQNGDKEAKDRVIVANMPLVHALAKRYRTVEGCEYDDLVQNGCIGLVQAVMKFDVTKGVMFSTYAVPLILGELKKYLRENNILKIGRTTKERSGQVLKKKDELTKELGRAPTIQELAEAMDLGSEQVVFALNAANNVKRLDEERGESDSTLLETMRSQENTEETAIRDVMLKDMIADLKPRHKKIIYLRYFLGKTQQDTAQEMGVSQVQVSRLEKKILLDLRQKSIAE